MEQNELQYIVVGVIPAEHFTVLGRCGDVSIHVGDVFDAVYRYKPLRYPDEMGDEPVREIERPASIRVICIHAFERSIKMMGEGMTGSLILDGDGLEFLGPEWILGRKCEDATVVEREIQTTTVHS
jgi:hypothetical protein